jgi:tripartite-type tricarboxylate transporter receptor subunit TctC
MFASISASRLRRRAMVALALGLAVSSPASADSYPSKPIRMIVPYAAGGATDLVARLIAQHLGAGLKQPVVVENRPGANGVIGTEAAAKAAPDGYTLLMNTAGAQTLNPVLFKVGYDPVRSFEPIAHIATIPLVLIVNPALPARTLQDYVALARAKGSPMSYASGTAMIELVTETFKTSAKIPDVQAVSYKGTGPALTAVAGGEVQMAIDPFVSIPMIKAGRVRPLAVLSPTRSSALPEVPTMVELGYRDMVFFSWAGLLAPAGTPKEIVGRVAEEMSRIMAMPSVRERLLGFDFEPVNGTPAQFRQMMVDETARWHAIVKATGYKATP